jgi:carbon starvation protein
MNTLVLGIFIVVWLTLGYRYYGGRVARRLVAPDDSRPTPAHTHHDGLDYHPAPNAVLFGHHFSSIAGAGPIVGPLIGVLFFGWVPALIWIALGSVFIGAVHDYLALMASVRHGGRSLGDLAEHYVGRRARLILAIFLWLALVLIIAVFGVITAQTFTTQPAIVLPTFGLIGLAFLFGWGVLRHRWLPLLPATLLALAILAGLILLGTRFPVDLGDQVFGLPTKIFWFWILMVYCVLASVLPVWSLLQPRDYLSTWILYLGLAGGFLGIVAAQPTIHSPAWIGFNSAAKGPLWPMLFVLIACGAVSGFHSLVAGGTTSKQLQRESDGQRIGYGPMIVEAALAGLVVLIAAGALRWDASAQPGAGSLQYLMAEGGGPIVAFATGFSQITAALGIDPAVGLFFGMLMINAFVITTLDTSTRLGRFILQELAQNVPALSNRWGATLFTVMLAAWLGASDSYTTIWPVFGATNQLVAALALIFITAWLVSRGKPRWYTLGPAIFMLVTCCGALVYQGIGFWNQGKLLLAAISVALLVLAAFLAWEARNQLWGKTALPGATAAERQAHAKTGTDFS